MFKFLDFLTVIGEGAQGTWSNLARSSNELATRFREWLGVQYGDIEIIREPNDEQGQVVFRFKNVPIIDIDLERQVVEQFTANEENAPENFGSELRTDSRRYEVRLAVPPQTKLGEVDYSDWLSREDFQVTIAQVNGDDLTPLPVDSDDYHDVCSTLARFAKVSIRSNPTTCASEFSTSRETTSWFKSFLNLFFNPGRAGREYIDSSAGLSQRLIQADYVYDLQVVAVDRALQDNDQTIFANYLDTVLQATVNEQLIAQQNYRKLKIDEIAMRPRSAFKMVMIAVGIIAAIAAAIIIATLLSPAMATWLAAITAIVLDRAIGRLFSIRGLVDATLLFGSFMAIVKVKQGWDLARRHEIEQQLVVCQERIHTLHEGMENIQRMKISSQRVFKILQEQGMSGPDGAPRSILDLSGIPETPAPTDSTNFFHRQFAKISQLFGKLFGNSDQNRIGDMELGLVCRYLISPHASPHLLELNLANNNITDHGAKDLGNLLTKLNQYSTSRLQTINLSGNPLTPEGELAILEGLRNNFTLTNLIYSSEVTTDPLKKSEQHERQHEIRQLLSLNRYLNGDIPASSEISELFFEDQALPQNFMTIFHRLAEELIENRIFKMPQLNTIPPATFADNAPGHSIFQRVIEERRFADAITDSSLSENLLGYYLKIAEPTFEHRIRLGQRIFAESKSRRLLHNGRALSQLDRDGIEQFLALSPTELDQLCRQIIADPNNRRDANIDILLALFATIQADSPQSHQILPHLDRIWQQCFELPDGQLSDWLTDNYLKHRHDHQTLNQLPPLAREQLVANIDQIINQNASPIQLAANRWVRFMEDHLDSAADRLGEMLSNYQRLPLTELAPSFDLKSLFGENTVTVREYLKDWFAQGVNADPSTATTLANVGLSADQLRALLSFCWENSDKGDPEYLAFLLSALQNPIVVEVCHDSQWFIGGGLLAEAFSDNKVSWIRQWLKMGDQRTPLQRLEDEVKQTRISAIAQGRFGAAEQLDIPYQKMLHQRLGTFRDTKEWWLRFAEITELRTLPDELNAVDASYRPRAEQLINRNTVHYILQHYPTDFQWQQIFSNRHRIRMSWEQWQTLYPQKKLFGMDNDCEKFSQLISEIGLTQSKKGSFRLAEGEPVTRFQAISMTFPKDRFANMDNLLAVAAVTARFVELPYSSQLQQAISHLIDDGAESFNPFVLSFRRKFANSSILGSLNEKIQQGLWDYLEQRFNQGESFYPDIVDFISQNWDLIATTEKSLELLIQIKDRNPKLYREIDKICTRNYLHQCLQDKPPRSLDFFNKYREVSINGSYSMFRALQSAQPSQKQLSIMLSEILKQDAGSETNLTLHNLRNLDSARQMILLTEMFQRNDSHEDALRKAALINQLLQLPNLFVHTSKPIQELKREIYQAIVPKKGMLYGEWEPLPYATLVKHLKDRYLTPGTFKEAKEYAPLLEGLNKALATAAELSSDNEPKSTKLSVELKDSLAAQLRSPKE